MKQLKKFLGKNQLYQQLLMWYEHCSPRNKTILQILTVVILIIFFHLVIWHPIARWSNKHQESYQYHENNHLWLLSNLDKARAVQKKQQNSAIQRELPSLVNSTARQASILLSRVQPDRKGVSVWIEDTAYQKILKWLVQLENLYDVRIDQIRIDKLKEEGRIKGYIHFGS